MEAAAEQEGEQAEGCVESVSVERSASSTPQPAAPLMVAKLTAPLTRGGLVPRPQLVARLDGARSTPLTILSAPAGYGKTTLLAAWLQQVGQSSERSQAAASGDASGAAHIAWLSLDAEDSDTARFWSYVLAALRQALPALPADLDALLHATPLQADSVVAGLINAIAALPNEVVLILDDYHLIADLRTHRSLAGLVEHCPPGLHLVIAGRADPPLPLARLQAQGRLNELRAADLRFSSAEAAVFLRQTMGLGLDDAASAALSARAEGWPAGLQLAALWLRDHPLQADEGMAALVDSGRYLLAFLAEEVIQRQSPEVQRFLLDTAVLDRWCPELCDYLVADDRRAEVGSQPLIARPAQQIIDELERRNLFVAALDPGTAWYRYHALFGDALRHELARQRGPGAVRRLHQRAAAWLAAASAENPALLQVALRHAVEGGAYDLAADLIVPRFDQLSAQGQIGQLLAWLAALPEAALAARPALALRYAWALFLDGRQGEAARWLSTAETVLATAPAADPLTTALPHVLRAAMATADHDDRRVLVHAERAAALLPPDAAFWRVMVGVAHGLAELTRGEARAAAAALQGAADTADQAESSYGMLVSLWHLGRTRLAMGRLPEAVRAFGRIGADGDPRYAGYRDVGLALVAYERNELAAAQEGALRGLRSLEAVAGQPRVIIAARGLLARIARDSGEPAEAAAWLERGEALARHLGLHEELAELLALRASFAVEDGDLAAAEEWAVSTGLDPSAPDVRREGELIVLAQALAARGDVAAAAQLAGLLRTAAVAQGRIRSAVICSLACALAHTQAGEGALASAALAEAARLAAQAGLLRLANRAAPSALAIGQRSEPAARAAGDGRHEQLSARELRVLRLIAAGCSNQEIASALIVSVNTIKTHVKRIYEKLQVNSRVGAVERARSLGLYH